VQHKYYKQAIFAEITIVKFEKTGIYKVMILSCIQSVRSDGPSSGSDKKPYVLHLSTQTARVWLQWVLNDTRVNEWFAKNQYN